MYCSKCGKELPEGARFCPHCGNSISPPVISSQSQDSNGHDQDIPLAERSSAPTAPPAPQEPQQDTPPESQQSPPPVPNEEIKCPRCGAVGCTPINKTNVTGGGYGCCSGGLGALILGPLGLLCGACGRSTKTTNTLVWVCPKCGHEFQAQSKKDMKTKYVASCCLMSSAYLFCAFLMLFADDIGRIGATVTMVFLDLIGAACYLMMYKFYIRMLKARYAFSDEERQQLKMVTVRTGVFSFICSVIPIIF